MRQLLAAGILAVLLAAAACEKATATLPATAAGWTRTSSSPIAAGDVPAVLTNLGLRSAIRYRYSGAVEAEADVFEMTSSTVAFEAMQKWQVAPGTMPFYKDRLLIVPRCADPPQLRTFAQALQQGIQ